jgi:hypothetical protein
MNIELTEEEITLLRNLLEQVSIPVVKDDAVRAVTLFNGLYKKLSGVTSE